MDTMSETVETLQQTSVDTADNAPQPATPETPDTGTVQTPPATEIAPEPKQTPWFQRRIDELTREKHDERRRAEALESQLRTIQQPQPQATAPNGYVPASEVGRLATEQVAQQRFVEACNAVADLGATKYPEFGTAVQNYALIGGVKPEFLQAIASLPQEDGARVYYELGTNPDAAIRIMAMSPVQMALEVAKMAHAPIKTAPVSRVPAPIEPITGGNTRSDAEPDAAANPKEWTAWFNKKRFSR